MTGNAMGGSRSSSHPDTVTAAEVTVPGRHRARSLQDTDTWTPVVPPHGGGHHRHRPGGEPVDAPAGALPLPPPRRRAADPRSTFAPTHGTLPAPGPGVLLPQPQQARQTHPRRPIPLPQPTRRPDEPREQHRLHEDYRAYDALPEHALNGRGPYAPPARGRTELPQPGQGDRGFTAGRLDEPGPIGGPLMPAAEPEPEQLWSGAQSGDLAEAAPEFAHDKRRLPAGQAGRPQTGAVADGPEFAHDERRTPTAQAGQPRPRDPAEATAPAYPQDERRAPAGQAVRPHSRDLAETAGPEFADDERRTLTAQARQQHHRDLAEMAGPEFTPAFTQDERRVPTGQAVVPDPQPVSEIDRAWAAPGTTRSLADVPMHDGLGRPQVRRSRRERVAATAATLAQPQPPELGEHDEPDEDEGTQLSALPEPAAEQPAKPEPPRRQRVTLRAGPAKPLVRGPFDEASLDEDDEVRVYAAPLLDGLGKFDLGSVPASVTPPKTWRKAAWFATGASGAVVVGLLFAGTFLVGGPTTTTDALGGGWPGRQNGGNPLILPDPSLGQQGGTGGDSPDRSRSGGGGRSGTRDDDPNTHPQNAAGSETSEDQPPTDSASSGDSSDPVTTGPTSTPSRPPAKPPITPAPRETAPTTVWYAADKDPKTMGDNSEKFFNNVTTDPNEAAAVTTGDLKQEGAQGLRQHYANVAYFEVKKVEIDPDNNTTVNTLEVTHTDGTKTVEQRTLTFGDDEKIADDGA
ncbi:hypothetical protein QRX50_03590 [Amycolatopsis carbonis]|uniref:Uncharacterized protein n=1 Tax=Amycolatopsis carbonis TaxID=715471 RepID=A0A9Y2IJ19_9PSEU|nr:hypothetical protein [Amycolatopsis sp. 2-15]WIX79896.1 hypothetical protein QRX50_03590 [Amycolatopsis sp. 2-15]